MLFKINFLIFQLGKKFYKLGEKEENLGGWHKILRFDVESLYLISFYAYWIVLLVLIFNLFPWKFSKQQKIIEKCSIINERIKGCRFGGKHKSILNASNQCFKLDGTVNISEQFLATNKMVQKTV